MKRADDTRRRTTQCGIYRLFTDFWHNIRRKNNLPVFNQTSFKNAAAYLLLMARINEAVQEANRYRINLLFANFVQHGIECHNIQRNENFPAKVETFRDFIAAFTRN